MNTVYPFSETASKMKASKIRELMKYASMPGVISFAGGLPDPGEFPFEDVKTIINNWDKEKIVRAMQYGPTSGFPPLIKLLKERMRKVKKINLNGQELIVTSGGQQAIFLTSRIFINKDDVVLIEEPSFIGAVAAFMSNGADLQSIPLEKDGINIDIFDTKIMELEKQGKKPKFFYTIPSFQNPGGISTSMKKKEQIYNLAKKYDLIILEDDPYSDLYFTEDPDNYLPIKSFGNDVKIIYLGSFSKILCPGFRLGWMISDEAIIDKAGLAKQSIDACSNSFGQVVAHDYLSNGLIDNYLNKMRKIYKSKKELMISMINKYVPEEVSATNPDGGFFIYLDLPANINGDEVFKKAFEKKVAFVTGEPFHIDPIEGSRHIRLAYSNSSNEEIEKGIKILGEAIKYLI